jgi:hypothetical protein
MISSCNLGYANTRSPDIAQAIIENVLSGIEDADVYIDDVGAFSKDWNHHINLLSTILCRLQENGFTINPLKCEWAIKETDWLGYWLTPCGLKPWNKKIDAIMHKDRPQNFNRAMYVHWLHQLLQQHVTKPCPCS